MDYPATLEKLIARTDLSEDETFALFDALFHGALTEAQIGDPFNVARAEETSHAIEDRAKRCRDAHLSRLGKTCNSPVKSLVYSDLLTAFRRQNDHLLNIAQTLQS